MRSSFLVAVVLALASSVFAQTAGFDVMATPTQDENIAVGTTYNIVWDPAGQTGTVSIFLLQGATVGTLSIGPTLAASIDNTLGTYAWAIPASAAGFATYGFKILLDSSPASAPIFQYSHPFHLTGGSSTSVSGSTTSTATVKVAPGPSYTSSNTSSSAPQTTSAASTSASKNSTVLTTVSTSASKTGSSSSTTPSAPAATKNAAIGNIATGGLAMVGGLVLAFAL